MQDKAWSRVRERNSFMVQLILPALLVIVLFQVIPIIRGIVISLHDFRLYREAAPYVGLLNYRKILLSPHFYKTVLLNTFFFVAVSLSIELLMGLGIALMYNKHFRGGKIARVIVLLPLMTPPVIIGLMFAWMFNDQFGIVNIFLSAVKLTPVPWLARRWSAFFVVILAEVWTWTPWFVLLVLAGLQAVPVPPCESAKIDGANRWQVFWYVVLPLLKPVIAVCLLIRFFDLFRSFDQVWALTRGGPARATELYSLYAYKESFVYLKFGMGSAAALIGAAIVMMVGVIMYKTFVSLVR